MPDPTIVGSEPGEPEPGTIEPGAGAEGTPEEAHETLYIEEFTMSALPPEEFEMGA